MYGNDNKVEYKNCKSFDYTSYFNDYIQGKGWQKPIEWKSLYIKDKSWEEESEYRFSINTPRYVKFEDEGFLLPNIKPSVVIVGYKMEKDVYEKIEEYCKNNRIALKKYMPRFDTQKIDFKTIDIL